MKRRIRYYGDDVLRIPGERVRGITPHLLRLVEDMKDTLVSVDGLGLAAQQVGETLLLAVIDLRSLEDEAQDLLQDGDHLVFVNPEVIEEEGSITDEEGCLSFPGLYLNIPRPERVLVRTQRIVSGEMVPLELSAQGFFARALMHEVDHLRGVLFIDHLSPFKRVRALVQWRAKLAEALRDSSRE